MFFILSKLLFVLISPLTWITLATAGALIFRKKKIGKKLLIAAVSMLIFFGNDFIVNEIFLAWEDQPQEFSRIRKTYDVAVILGGVTRTDMEPRDRVYFDRGADRVIHPFFLYNQRKVKNFIVSGGTGRLVNKKFAEAPALAMALEQFGVPKENIFVEDKSRNTHENATLSKKIILQNFGDGASILVVTSAFHMPRASRCFSKVGLTFDTLSTDFLSHPRQFTLDVLLIPNMIALIKWNTLTKEWVGICAYKLAGYI